LYLERLEDRLAPATVSWNVDTDGNWNTAKDWSTGTVPGPNDDVVINRAGSVTVTIDSGSQSVHSLKSSSQETVALSGGSLTVATASEIDGSFQWTGGSIAGNGAGLTMAGTVAITGSNSVELFGTLNNTGTITQNASGIFYFGNGVLNNQASGVYDIQAGRMFVDYGSNTINNSGTFEKSIGTGTASVGITFNNAGGSISVQAGILSFSNGGTSTGGTYNVAGGAQVNYAGGTHTLSGTYTGSGAGTVVLSSGTVNIPGTVTFNFGGGGFDIAGGTLSGSGMLNNSGTASWTGGSIQGTGAGLTIAGTLAITGSNSVELFGTLNNTGTITQNASGIFYFGNGVLNNQASGVYDFQAGRMFVDYGTNAVNNSGTFEKSSGTGTSTVGIAFNNTGGSISAQAATLSFSNGGTSTGGTYNVANGAEVNYAGGTHTLSGTYSGSGTGLVLLSSGTVSVGSTVTLNLGAFDIAGGTLTGSGTLNNLGTASWTGGSIQGTGAGLTIAGTLAITGSNSVELFGTLTNTGTITQNASGIFYFGNGVLNNQASGVYDFQAGRMFVDYGTNAVNNSGMFEKSTGAGTASEGITFNNTGGSISVQAGTLSFSNGGTSTGGTYSVAGGAQVNYAGGTHTLSGTYSGSGAGTVVLSNGTVNIPGTVTFNIGGGGFDIAGGTLSGSGMLNNSGTASWTGGSIQGTGAGLTVAGTLVITGNNYVELFGTLNNTGTITKNSGSIFYFGNGVLNNDMGAVYDFQAGSMLNDYGTNAVNNSGTFEKSAGAGTASVGIAFNNTGGSIRAQAGTLSLPDLSGGGGGSLNAAAGASLLLNGTLTGSYSGSPAGFVGVSSGTLQSGTGGLTLSLGGTGFGWSGGVFTGQVTNAGLLTMTGSNYVEAAFTTSRPGGWSTTTAATRSITAARSRKAPVRAQPP
jgi:hypothetical protein